MHRFSLRGMNYDQVQNIEQSGELSVLKLVKQKITRSKKPVLFDVGANTADYARMLALQFLQGMVYCFEALPSTYAILKTHLSGINNVVAIQSGLGAKNETLPFFSDGAGSGLSSFYSYRVPYAKSIEVHRLPVTTPDSFCKIENMERIDFFKN